jgi:hydroxymethylbilane synthase
VTTDDQRHILKSSLKSPPVREPFSLKTTDSRPLRIATRNSPLAMWQAKYVASRLHDLGHPTTLVPLVSSGDVDMAPIDGTRQVGVFTKRIQQALLDDEADVAVHSLKDLPTEVIPQLRLAAVPVRETVADAIVSRQRYTIDTLPPGAKIGTGSKRRAAQLKFLRPDLQLHPIRGNVQTRLSKLDGESFAVPRTLLSLDEMLPAPGQGALGIEVRSDDDRARRMVASLNDPETSASVTAERTLLASLHGGCLAPIAALASVQSQPGLTSRLILRAVVLSADGRDRIDETGHIGWPDSREVGTNVSGTNVIESMLARVTELGVDLGNEIAGRLAARGAREMIAAAR